MEFELGIIIWKLLAVLFLVCLNGFFVASEFAIVKIRDTQLTPMINKGSRRAKIARDILAHLDWYLSAAQLGITLASLALGWIGEPVFAALLDPLMVAMNIHSEEVRHTVSVIVGLSALTFLHITVGEQAPKWMAIQHALPTSLWVAWPMLIFYRLTFPFIWVLNKSSLWMLRQVGIEAGGEGEGHSVEELRLLFASSHQPAHASDFGRNIVLNALDLRNRVAREVMRPRQEIVVINTEASLTECLDVVDKTRFSRLPLCERGNVDRTLGVVHIKDMFAMRFKAKSGADFMSVARQVIYIPETARLEKVLQLLLDRKVHMAMVVDEFGGTVGLVTLENILEEVVGQIQDEFDQEIPLVIKQGEDTWQLQGTLPLHDLAELTAEPIEEEGITTASGWITHKLGGFPKIGDTVTVGTYQLRVEELDGPRVSRLVMKKLPSGEPAAA